MDILLLDDSLDNLNLLKLYTRKSTDRFVMTADIDDALGLIEREKFDLFFLDIQMPVRDGFSVLDEVRDMKNGKGLFTCALTAHTSPIEIEKIKKSNFDDYLQKPILRQDFLSYIEEFSLKIAV